MSDAYIEHLKAVNRGGWSPDSIPGKNADAEFEAWLAQERLQAQVEVLDDVAWRAMGQGIYPELHRATSDYERELAVQNWLKKQIERVKKEQS